MNKKPEGKGEGPKDGVKGDGKGKGKPRSRSNSQNQSETKTVKEPGSSRGGKGKSRSRSNSQNETKPVKMRAGGGGRGRGGARGGSHQGGKQSRKLQKPSRDYEDEEWRTVYIGFVERGTSEQELLHHFKDSGEVERLTLKEGFAFILFKEEKSVQLACRLDGTSLHGLNLRVAPRKEKPPEVKGDVLLDLDMKKFRNEKQEKLFTDIEDFIQTFDCVGSFSQDQKEANSIVIPGCPQLLDWNKMEAEEGEITLIRQAENAPELNTTDSILKSVKMCSPELDFSKIQIVTNRSCLMKLLAPVDPSIIYTSNKCFRMTAVKAREGPIFLNLESKWHPTMGTTKSFQDAITSPLPEKVKNLAYPGIFYRIITFDLGKMTVMVRIQVHAEDEEPMLEFEEDDPDSGDNNAEDFFDIEDRNGDADAAVDAKSGDTVTDTLTAAQKKLSAAAAEFVPPVHTWNVFPGTDLKWVKNDAIFSVPESRYEVKTVDIAGNFWEYNAEKTFYQMLLGGIDYLLLGVLLNNAYVINKEEYDLSEVHAKVLGTKNPSDATLVLSKMEKILSKIVELSVDLKENQRLEIVFDGKREHLTFYKVQEKEQEKVSK